jgi:predicted acyltransferase
VLVLTRVPDGAGGTVSLKSWVYAELCAPAAGQVNGSLLFALANVALWLGILWWLDRRGLHLKI